MKIFPLIAILLLIFSRGYGQFTITEERVAGKNDTFPGEGSGAPFYEDEKYIISKSCSGEFGGTISFRNKQSGIERSCSAVCAVAINKIGDSYFVTNSLAHLAGSAEVVEIKDPEALEVFRMPPPRKKKGKVVFRYVGDDESRSTAGTVILADSVGMNILGSFVYNKNLYHICTDFRMTYLSTIQNQKFVTIAQLSSERLQARFAAYCDNDRFIVPFTNGNGNGKIEIKADQILVLYCLTESN